MTTERKIAANRKNAKKSTGPQTRCGKDRTRRNAIRHGLSSTNLDNPGICNQVDRIVKMMCGERPGILLYDQAVVIAESQILLARVRALRTDFIERMRGQAAHDERNEKSYEAACLNRALTEVLSLERYERRALSRRRRAMRSFNSLLNESDIPNPRRIHR